MTEGRYQWTKVSKYLPPAPSDGDWPVYPVRLKSGVIKNLAFYGTGFCVAKATRHGMVGGVEEDVDEWLEELPPQTETSAPNPSPDLSGWFYFDEVLPKKAGNFVFAYSDSYVNGGANITMTHFELYICRKNNLTTLINNIAFEVNDKIRQEVRQKVGVDIVAWRELYKYPIPDRGFSARQRSNTIHGGGW